MQGIWTYEIGSLDLNDSENNTYIDEITKIVKEIGNNKSKNIYFNLQNSEIIIRNLENIKTKRQKEIIQLIKYEIGTYMPLNLQNYVIKYKKIINNKDKWSIQGILFPKKYVDICKLISENLKIKKKYLYINFDILQKLIDLRLIDLSQNENDKITIIENRENEAIVNLIVDKKIMESYSIEKYSNQYSSNQISCDNNTYYYGINDDFIKHLQIKKLNIKKQLILNSSNEIEDVMLRHLSSIGMII